MQTQTMEGYEGKMDLMAGEIKVLMFELSQLTRVRKMKKRQVTTVHDKYVHAPAYASMAS